jgi:hypothetical protein
MLLRFSVNIFLSAKGFRGRIEFGNTELTDSPQRRHALLLVAEIPEPRRVYCSHAGHVSVSCGRWPNSATVHKYAIAVPETSGLAYRSDYPSAAPYRGVAPGVGTQMSRQSCRRSFMFCCFFIGHRNFNALAIIPLKPSGHYIYHLL